MPQLLRMGPSRGSVYHNGFALNGRVDVFLATREKIVQLVREKSFVSNQHARSLVKKLSRYIGFAAPRVGALYLAQIAVFWAGCGEGSRGVNSL